RLSEIERRLLDLGIFARAVVVAGAGSPAPITVQIEEAAPLKLTYDLRYNNQEGGSGLVDSEAVNLLGSGFTLGGRYRVGRQLRQENPPPPTPPTEPLLAVQKGLQVQQAVHAFHPVDVLYGYRFKQVTVPSSIFAIPITPKVAGIDASAVLNTRSNILDPVHG